MARASPPISPPYSLRNNDEDRCLFEGSAALVASVVESVKIGHALDADHAGLHLDKINRHAADVSQLSESVSRRQK